MSGAPVPIGTVEDVAAGVIPGGYVCVNALLGGGVIHRYAPVRDCPVGIFRLRVAASAGIAVVVSLAAEDAEALEVRMAPGGVSDLPGLPLARVIAAAGGPVLARLDGPDADCGDPEWFHRANAEFVVSLATGLDVEAALAQVKIAAGETPVDLAAVQADDALLDALAAGEFDARLSRAGVTLNPATADADTYRLALVKVLAAWRRDVDTEPIGELVDTDTALAAINSGRKPTAPRQVPWWVWLLLLIANSAAFFALIEAVSR